MFIDTTEFDLLLLSLPHRVELLLLLLLLSLNCCLRFRGGSFNFNMFVSSAAATAVATLHVISLDLHFMTLMADDNFNYISADCRYADADCAAQLQFHSIQYRAPMAILNISFYLVKELNIYR